MKIKIRIVLWLVIGIMAGMMLFYWFNKQCKPDREVHFEEVSRDTVVDTITYIRPQVQDSVVVRYKEVRITSATKRRQAKTDSIKVQKDSMVGDAIFSDTISMCLPIIQKHYVDSLYQAWISGYDVTLDSIEIYSKRETVVLQEKKPPNRWHIGPTIGYGLTPQGFKPFAGISITYSVISF